MLRLLPELIVGPLLVGCATLAGRRWGTRIGGVVSALPAVVGPVLLITASEGGAVSAARAANGTLLGLVALSGFVVTYARVALRARWGLSLLSGWVCAALIAVLVGWVAHGAPLADGLAASVGSLLLAYRAMPPSLDLETGGAGPTRITARMAMTAVLVASLAAAVVLVGPVVGGMLAALPLLASVLAVFTHRREGPSAVIALLRGMLVGMAGFVGFCAIVAWLIVPLGATSAFCVASATAVGLQLFVLARTPRRAPLRTAGLSWNLLAAAANTGNVGLWERGAGQRRDDTDCACAEKR